MMMIVATLPILYPAAGAVVAVDMIHPRRAPRLIPLRPPLVAPAQWPRIGDEMRAGIQAVGEDRYTLWLRGTKWFRVERHQHASPSLKTMVTFFDAPFPVSLPPVCVGRRWSVDGRPVELRLYGVGKAGTNLRNRVSLPSLTHRKGMSAGALALSQDERWAAFDAVQFGRSRVFLWRMDQRSVRRLCPAENLVDLRWSPDHRRLMLLTKASKGGPRGYGGLYDARTIDMEGRVLHREPEVMGAVWTRGNTLICWRVERRVFSPQGMGAAPGLRFALSKGKESVERRSLRRVLGSLSTLRWGVARNAGELAFDGQFIGTRAFSPSLDAAYISSFEPLPSNGNEMTVDAYVRANGSTRFSPREQLGSIYQVVAASGGKGFLAIGNPLFVATGESLDWDGTVYVNAILPESGKMNRSRLIVGLESLDVWRFVFPN